MDKLTILLDEYLRAIKSVESVPTGKRVPGNRHRRMRLARLAIVNHVGWEKYNARVSS